MLSQMFSFARTWPRFHSSLSYKEVPGFNPLKHTGYLCVRVCVCLSTTCFNIKKIRIFIIKMYLWVSFIPITAIISLKNTVRCNTDAVCSTVTNKVSLSVWFSRISCFRIVVCSSFKVMLKFTPLSKPNSLHLFDF